MMKDREFRDALGAFATGVTIVTTRMRDGTDIGITANSFNSVSLDPPMVLWSLSRKARSLQAFLENPRFAIHVLAHDQEHLSRRFATAGADKFAGEVIHRGHDDVPLLSGCSALFECRTAYRHDGGDHVIFVGEVVEFQASGRAPLLYHAGRYALAVRKQDAQPDSSFSRDFLVSLLNKAAFQLGLAFRTHLDRFALSEEEWLVLSLLGAVNDQTVAQLDGQLSCTGRRVRYESVARLAATGYVELIGGHDPGARVHLTHAGHEVLVQLVAVAKGIEAHAERELGPEDTQFLKQALRLIIRETEPPQGAAPRSFDEE